MANPNIKQDAKRLVENLPPKATWDDLMHEIYVRQAIESGLRDSKAGKSREVKEVRAKYGVCRGASKTAQFVCQQNCTFAVEGLTGR